MQTRKYTNGLLEMVEEGWVDKDYVIQVLSMYLSDDEVRDCMKLNEIKTIEELEEEMEE